MSLDMLYGVNVETPTVEITSGYPVDWVMEEFPNVTFSLSLAEELSAEVNGSKKTLYGDVDIMTVLLCDLNYDGKREIVSQIKKNDILGVRAYDYANHHCYEYWADYMTYSLNVYDDGVGVVLNSTDGEFISQFGIKLYDDDVMAPLAKYSGFRNVSSDYNTPDAVSNEYLNADPNTPVYATVNGEVIKAVKLHSSMGNCIVILGDDGRYHYYASLGDISANVGDRVTIGQEIGTVGNSGYWALGDGLGVRYTRLSYLLNFD